MMQRCKWLAALLMIAMALGLFGQVALANSDTSITVDEAVQFLREFGVVQGDPSGELRLTDPITRAEMVKVLVVALGREREALILTGARAFNDTPDHWASGYIAVAANLGLVNGYPDGTFKPDNPVTNAEVLALITRAAGVPAVEGQPWPNNVLGAAAAAGVVPPGVDMSAVANTAATRGGVFLMAHRGFLLVKDASGKNVYQRALDTEAPVLTVGSVPATTSDASITVSGTVTGAAQLTVNGQPVAIGSGGAFSVAVSLEAGENEIRVEATDKVGNVARQTLSVGRVAGAPQSITAPATLTLEAGESREIEVAVKDANGLTIPDAGLTAEISGDLGSFDPDTRVFTAAEQPGTGTLTLRAGNATAKVTVTIKAGAIARVEVTSDKESVAIGEQAVVTARAYDAYDNEITGLGVLYSVTGAGALINQTTGVFMGAQEGLYTVRATIGTTTGSVQVGVYGKAADLRIAGPSEVVGNGKGNGPFRVLVVDRNGSLVANDDGRTVTLDTDVDDLEFVDANGNALVGNRLTLDKGQGTFYVKAGGDLWGVIAEITATDDDDDDFEDTTTIEIAEQTAVAVAVKRQDDYLPANDSEGTAEITFVIVDQDGQEMLDGTWDIDWSIASRAREKDTGATSGTLTFVAGQEAPVLILSPIVGQLGEVRVTASAEELKPVTVTLTAEVVGASERVSLKFDRTQHVVGDDVDDDGGIEVTVQVTDAKGVPVEYNGDVTIRFSPGFNQAVATDDSGSGLNPVDSDGDALGLFEELTVEFNNERKRTFKFISQIAGDMTLTAKTGSLTQATGTVNFRPGSAATAGFSTDTTLVAVNANRGEAVVQVMDEFGNRVPQSGVSIRLQARKGVSNTEEITINGRRGADTVRTGDDGRAIVSFTVRADPTANYSIQVESAQGLDPDDDTGRLAIKVLPALPDDIRVSFYLSGGSKKASIGTHEVLEVRVEIWDEDNLPIGGIADYLKIVVPDGAFDVDGDKPGDSAEAVARWVKENEKWEEDPDKEGVYTLELQPAKAGSARVTVQVDVGGRTVSGSSTITINPGLVHHAILKEANMDGDTPEINVVAGSVSSFTLQVVDAWDNVVSSGTYTVRFINNTNIRVRSTPIIDIAPGEDFKTGRSKTIYILALKSNDDGRITIELDETGNQWDFDVNVE